MLNLLFFKVVSLSMTRLLSSLTVSLVDFFLHRWMELFYQLTANLGCSGHFRQVPHFHILSRLFQKLMRADAFYILAKIGTSMNTVWVVVGLGYVSCTV